MEWKKKRLQVNILKFKNQIFISNSCNVYIFILFLSLLLFNISCTKKQEIPRDEAKDIKDLDGWYTGGGKEGGYEIGAEQEKYNGQPVYYLKSKADAKEEFGTIAKNFNPGNYMGKRIRLSGNIKSDKVYGWAGMWLRIDGGNGNAPYGNMLEFDNMQGRPIKETTDWKKYEIVTDVPRDSRMLFYGALLNGKGSIRISDLKFDTVGTNIPPTTFIPQKPYNP